MNARWTIRFTTIAIPTLCAVVVGCNDNSPVCIPDASVEACICASGERGHRVCNSGGLEYAPCECGEADEDGGTGPGVADQ